MNRKTLVQMLLASTFLIAPYNLSKNTDAIYSKVRHNIETAELSPLEKAGLKVNGEYQRSIGTNFFDFYRLVYSDKDDESNPLSLEPSGPKTAEELKKGLVLKDSLEKLYHKYLESQDIDWSNKSWNRFIDGEQIIPEGTYVRGSHEAIDIFTQEGNRVLAPFDGLVVASGDGWEGKFDLRNIYEWNNKGFSPRAGNAIIVYDPTNKGYMLISHFTEGLSVQAGDVIKQGQTLGCVGHSGSASIKGHGEHIHVVYKLPDKEGYLKGIDFSDRIK